MIRTLLKMPLLVGLSACGHTSGEERSFPPKPITEPCDDPESAKTVYHDWALSRCLGKAARDTEDRDDAFATAGGYLEKGKLGMEVYAAMEKLADAALAKPYGSVVGSELRTMKCIDLYHSAELNDLIARALARQDALSE